MTTPTCFNPTIAHGDIELAPQNYLINGPHHRDTRGLYLSRASCIHLGQLTSPTWSLYARVAGKHVRDRNLDVSSDTVAWCQSRALFMNALSRNSHLY